MLDGRVSLALTLEALEGLDAEAGLNPSDEGLLVLPATCNPPWLLGLGLVIGASPPPGCGLCPCPGLYEGYDGYRGYTG